MREGATDSKTLEGCRPTTRTYVAYPPDDEQIASEARHQRRLVGMGDSRMVSAHQRESEQGVREVSSALFNRVTNYHAQIGANVNKETLQSLEWQVLCHRAL